MPGFVSRAADNSHREVQLPDRHGRPRRRGHRDERQSLSIVKVGWLEGVGCNTVCLSACLFVCLSIRWPAFCYSRALIELPNLVDLRPRGIHCSQASGWQNDKIESGR